MPFLHIPSGAAGEVIAATVALFLILLAAVIAATTFIAIHSRTHMTAWQGRLRSRVATRQAQAATHPQGGTP